MWKSCLIVVALLLSGVCAATDYVFINVNVIDVASGEVLPGRAVTIVEGKIGSVADARVARLSSDLERIDAAGKFLLPGLAEMHAHVPRVARQQAVRDTLLMYLSQGITTARGMLGEPGHLKLREQLAKGEIPGPRLYTSGPSLNGRSVSSPQQAEQMVRDQHAAGYDHIKIHPGLTQAEYDAVARTGKALGIKYAGHVDASYGALHAIDGGIATIDHMDGLVEALVPPDTDFESGFFGLNAIDQVDRERIELVCRRLKAAGTAIVPTESLIDRRVGPRSADELLAEPGMQLISSSTKASWRGRRDDVERQIDDREPIDRFLKLRRDLIHELHDGGVTLLLGSDAPQVFQVPGYAIHDELAIYVNAGLSPAEALRTGTVNVAMHLGAGDRRGQIKPGFDADLVLLNANPLADIANTRAIAGVMVDGRWFDGATLRAGLDEIAARVE